MGSMATVALIAGGGAGTGACATTFLGAGGGTGTGACATTFLGAGGGTGTGACATTFLATGGGAGTGACATTFLGAGGGADDVVALKGALFPAAGLCGSTNAFLATEDVWDGGAFCCGTDVALGAALETFCLLEETASLVESSGLFPDSILCVFTKSGSVSHSSSSAPVI